MKTLKRISALLLFFLCITVSTTSFAEAGNIDSLLSDLANSTDTSRINTLITISNYYSENDTKKSIDYGYMALEESEKLQYLSGQAKALNAIAMEYDDLSNYDKAVDLLNQALVLFKKLNMQEYIARVNSNLGIVYRNKAEYKIALEYCINSLKIHEQLNDLQGQGRALNGIANIYFCEGNADMAIGYYKKTIDIFGRLNNKKGIATGLTNIANVYTTRGLFDKAIEFYTQSLDMYKEINNKFGVSRTYNNLANVYYYQQNYEKSLDLHLSSLKLELEQNNTKGVIMSYNNCGEIYTRLDQYDKALECFNKALSMAKLSGDLDDLKASYKHLSIAYADLNDFKKAYQFQNLYVSANDSLLNEQTTKQMADMEVKYQADKKDKENALLTQQNKIASIAANKQKAIIALLGVVVLLLIVMGIIVYYRFVEKKKMAETLTKLSIVASKTDNYVSITDKDDIISWTNDGFTRITGYDSDEVKNKSLPSLLRGNGTDIETINRINEKKNSGKPFTEEILNYRKDGSPVWLSFNVSPVYSEAGVIEKYIAIGSDVTEKKKAEQQLQFFARTLEEKNKSISDSIQYASKIQAAILPPQALLQENLQNYFVLYKPKDVVSGDFYWLEKKDDIIYFAVVDCTGHGVPGALMSMIGFNSLNKIVRENLIYSPANILDKLNDEIEAILRQKDFQELKDGMDIALCMYDTKTRELEYAGANNPLYIVRKYNEGGVNAFDVEPIVVDDNVLYEIKADRQPIGIFENRKQFTNHKFVLAEGDRLFLFSDGYADQFGGPKRKKFQYRKLKELLLKISDKAMAEQKILLESAFYDWKGDNEQIDDICVLGVKI